MKLSRFRRKSFTSMKKENLQKEEGKQKEDQQKSLILEKHII